MSSSKLQTKQTVIELALLTVHATGDAQDHAAEIVSRAGGRLLSLNEFGFTAQVTNRPETIDQMLARLNGEVVAGVVRSGGLSLDPVVPF